MVITGGSTGIGRAVAKEFCSRGAASITLMARTESKLKEAVADVGNVASYVTCDVTSEASVEDAMKKAAGSSGPIDVLVACAGTSYPDTFSTKGATCLKRRWS